MRLRIPDRYLDRYLFSLFPACQVLHAHVLHGITFAVVSKWCQFLPELPCSRQTRATDWEQYALRHTLVLRQNRVFSWA